MMISSRPSKIVFHNKFIKLISDAEPFEAVLDCASASAKNAALFPNKEYYGVDIDNELIEIAKTKYRNNPLIHLYQDDIVNIKSVIKIMAANAMVYNLLCL